MKPLLFLALLTLSAPVLAQPAEPPLVRTTVKPAEGVVVGQAVAIDVSVLFPGEMAHPPQVSLPEATGAQIFRFESQAVTVRDRIDNRDYVGQTFEFVLFPRRGGTIDIPAAKVTLLDRGGDPVGSAEGSPSRIAVSVPPGIDVSGPVLVSDKVEVSQDWSPDPAKAKLAPGSAIVRTIRREAEGVPALAMAEFAFTAPEGMRVYVDTPVVEDRTNRGEVTGLRTDKVTYVFERAGSFDLPALAQPWWSLASKQARAEALPGVGVRVATASVLAKHVRLEPSWLASGLAVLGGFALMAIGGPLLVRAWRSRQEHYRASAAFARRQLLKAAGTGNPALTYQALMDWRRRLAPTDLAAADRDPALAAASGRLGQALFGDGRNWHEAAGAALAQAVADWRPRAGLDAAAEPLPPLNPIAGSMR